MKLKLSFLILAGITVAFASCSSDEPEDKPEEKPEENVVPQQRLVGEFTFSGNADDTNPTGILHHGAVHGAILTTDRHGKANSAYAFDGVDDYINIADNDSLDFATGDNFTVSVWASVSATQASTNAVSDIVRKWSGNAEGYPYAIAYLNSSSSVPNTFVFVKYDGSGCANAPTGYSPVINDGAWHHLVLKREGSMVYSYVDGVEIAAVADQTVCTTTNTSQVTFGCRGQLATFFTGKIDDVRFYSRALKTSEMEKLYAE